MRATGTALAIALLVVGAAGLSSLQSDDFCAAANVPEGSGWSTEPALWPPGWRCLYDGGTETREAGSGAGFAAALAAGLAVFALRRRFPWAWAAALAFAVTGAAALLASPFVAFFAGLLAGAPLAAFVTDSAARGIAAAGAVILAGVLWLFGLGLAAFGLALLPLLAVPARRGATSAPGRPAAAGGQ